MISDPHDPIDRFQITSYCQTGETRPGSILDNKSDVHARFDHCLPTDL
jgi:hypothetical protein